MKKQIYSLLMLLGITLAISACSPQTRALAPGTYEGVITEVRQENRQILVTINTGEQLELTLTDRTELVSNNESVPFTALINNAPVQVTVERDGSTNIPTRIELVSNLQTNPTPGL